jgi:hypothetical protein
MTAARSSTPPNMPYIPFAAGCHMWDKALKSFSDPSPDTIPFDFARVAGEVHALAEASARNWKTLADFHWSAAHDLMTAPQPASLADLTKDWATLTWTLASREAERQQASVRNLIGAFWPAEPAPAASEAAHV